MSDMVADTAHWMLDHAVHLLGTNLEVGRLHMMPQGPANDDNIVLISNAR